MNNQELLIMYDNELIKTHGKLYYRKTGDAGLDLCNASSNSIEIKPGQSVEVPAGLRLKVPDGYVGLIRCRSSAFSKRGLMVIHNTIDSNYTGPMFTTVWHPGIAGRDSVQIIEPWERISQIIIVPVINVVFKEVSEFPNTSRNQLGFGSSGL